MKKQQYKTVIIDDSPEAIEQLLSLLNSFSEFHVVAIAREGISGKKTILEHKPDLVFVDVEMPGLSGLEMLQELSPVIQWPMQVIFCTAYEKYLLEALRASAFDFLLKPITSSDFSLVIDRYRSQCDSPNATSFIEEIEKIAPCNKRFMLATATGFIFLKTNEICYFDHDKTERGWNVYTTEGKSYSLKRKTNSDTILSYSGSFVQISKCHIINLDFLSVIANNECKLFPPYQSIKLPVSRIYQSYLYQRFEEI